MANFPYLTLTEGRRKNWEKRETSFAGLSGLRRLLAFYFDQVVCLCNFENSATEMETICALCRHSRVLLSTCFLHDDGGSGGCADFHFNTCSKSYERKYYNTSAVYPPPHCQSNSCCERTDIV